MFTSNAFKTSDKGNVSTFECFSCKLIVPEKDAMRCLKEEAVTASYYVTNGKIFYLDESIKKYSVYRKIVGDCQESALNMTKMDRLWEKIVRNIIQREVAQHFIKKGLLKTHSKDGPFYYPNNDPLFELRIPGKEGEAIYKAMRGVKPQVYVSDEDGSIIVIFEVDSSSDIFISYGQWPKWIGYEVFTDDPRVKLRGGCLLEDFNEMTQKATLTRNGETFEVDADSLKIVKNNGVYKERNIYEELNGFSSFKRYNSGYREFFNKLNEILLEDGKLVLRLPSLNMNKIELFPVIFEEE